MIKTVLLTLTALLAASAVAATALVYSGLYNVGATTQHTQFVYSLLETAMRQSVRLRSRDIVVPPLSDAAMVSKGAACYAQKCVQCHGGPGVPQGDVGKSLQPLPGPLVDARQRWKPEQLYWITRHGIRMSGMPAWELRLADAELWQLVAFLQALPDMTPRQYEEATRTWTATTGVEVEARSACGLSLAADADAATGAAIGAVTAASSSSSSVAISDAASAATTPRPATTASVERGRVAMYQYACSACHTIPGIVGSSPNVGPPLEGIGSRSLIAGKLENTPENMVRWLRETRKVDPSTAMPQLGVTDAHARDMAAFLATLR